ncbi:MAG: putative selenate reductase [Candidatus Desulfovibrio kirbyi]|uniref:dihydrouracil dehydrogenase (NAD(+)) n=1 Tax=Candidatus Desulfovibrio kirbyi TaxID=2696086 RepID=A0A6L2R6K1_9BACT|nr:MAG: putative selenate reductase [Candidatus Desulfovibrio kirbyi]
MAGDHMHGLSAEQLLKWILADLERGSVFGIVKDLFFIPKGSDPFRMQRYNVTLETPLGAAAGPHTQMAQNIIAAWFCGARYMELKTVQTLDAITVSKPCIDMKDEGYNCEWSQELSLDKSYAEYLTAWVLLHILHHHMGFAGKPGMIFNMSAGYSMEGILTPKMQHFLDSMQDASKDVQDLKRRLAQFYPATADIDIPGCISDNLTISCMHGCPPAEVEKIALYFIEDRKLNTTLKMNPTLLGPNRLRGILNKTLGYEVEVPDIAFEHDLPYEEALRIIKSCREAGARVGKPFSVKLTNTLETTNAKQNLPDSEKMVYMSGRSLHPISIAVAERLQKDFAGDLDISFCAGVDALNVVDTLACGLSPITVCSDLLKPGGYGRLAQYIVNLRQALKKAEADSIEDFIISRAKAGGLKNDCGDVYRSAILKNLETYAAQVTAEGSRYAKANGSGDVKSLRPLPALDCAAAPCMSACPARQPVPVYLAYAASGDMDGALRAIYTTNPFPHVLGKMCNQACKSKCMRGHYDEGLHIRDIKRCAAEAGKGNAVKPAPFNGRAVVVIGGGVAGLTCAYYLALSGCKVSVYEASDKLGGRMLSKMSRETERTARDVGAILALGVTVHTNHRVSEGADKFKASCAAVYDSTTENSLSLVESVGRGRRAAMDILSGLEIIPPVESAHSAGLDYTALRAKQAYRVASHGKTTACEDVVVEAGRCLSCDRYCGICVSVCPNRANVLLASQMRSYPVQEAVRAKEGVRIVTLAQGSVRLPWQVVNLGDFCNECGNCSAFCPSMDAPYRVKFRLHLSEKSFAADQNGLLRLSATVTEGKRQGENFSLRAESDVYVYKDKHVRVKLDRVSLAALEAEFLNAEVASASLLQAVQAAIFSELTAGTSAVCAPLQ